MRGRHVQFHFMITNSSNLDRSKFYWLISLHYTFLTLLNWIIPFASSSLALCPLHPLLDFQLLPDPFRPLHGKISRYIYIIRLYYELTSSVMTFSPTEQPISMSVFLCLFSGSTSLLWVCNERFRCLARGIFSCAFRQKFIADIKNTKRDLPGQNDVTYRIVPNLKSMGQLCKRARNLAGSNGSKYCQWQNHVCHKIHHLQ